MADKKATKSKADTEYAVRCFVDKKQRRTHALTKKEARMLRMAANHLVAYLTEAYRLSPRD